MHVPPVRVYDRDRMGIADESQLAEIKDLQTPGLPIHRESRLKMEIGEDGMVKVVLTRGKADDFIKAFLGTRRLFTPAK
jgi:hypothetical protein